MVHEDPQVALFQSMSAPHAAVDYSMLSRSREHVSRAAG